MRVSSVASAKRPGSSSEARRQQRNHLRREGERDREQHDLDRDHHGENAVGEQLRRVRPVLGADARIGRNEGGVERTFGEDRAEMIGQPQRDEEGVGDRAGAEDRRQHDVARESGDARKQREAADGENASDHDRKAILLAGLDPAKAVGLSTGSRLRGNARPAYAGEY